MMEVVAVTRLSEDDRRRIEAVDPKVHLTDAGTWFDGEIAATWPAQTARNWVREGAEAPPKADRDGVLATAEVIFGGFPYPLDLRARSPRLKWFHQRNAGANNLWRGDLWRSDILVTTSRGYVNVRPIAEYVAAALLYLARDFGQAHRDRADGAFERRRHHPLLLADKTACIVGAGGIGREAGRLLAALGMNVIGVRREPHAGEALPEGFAAMVGRDRLLEALGQSQAAVVACQLTRETEGLLNRAAFQAMRPDGMFVNIARGEIVDESAMIEALDTGHLRGAVLDVYVGEFDGPPGPVLWSHPKILITPHDSGRTETTQNLGIDIFCDNLRAYLDGRSLKNVVDWERGY